MFLGNAIEGVKKCPNLVVLVHFFSVKEIAEGINDYKIDRFSLQFRKYPFYYIFFRGIRKYMG